MDISLRILVISRSPWERNNSTGNTLTDLFEGMNNADVFSICMREAPVLNNQITKKNLFISERLLFNSIRNRGPIGQISKLVTCDEKENLLEKKLYNAAKKSKLMIPYFVREALWEIGLRNKDSLDSFLEEVKPDIVFSPIFLCWYSQKLLCYIKEKTNAKIVTFHTDDCYSLKQFSLSPLFWIYRFIQRRWIKKVVYVSDRDYAITPLQQQEYGKEFNKEFHLLTKAKTFEKKYIKKEIRNPIQFVFTGNLENNRWKTLHLIIKAMQEINQGEVKLQLKIYSSSTLTNRIFKRLNIHDTSFFCGAIPSRQVEEVQQNSDVLIHVEAFDLVNRLKVRQSFSTKIVDYLSNGVAVFACGPSSVASIRYFKDNNCGIVCTEIGEIKSTLESIITNKDIIYDYAERAFLWGKANHNRDSLKKKFHSELEMLIS